MQRVARDCLRRQLRHVIVVIREYFSKFAEVREFHSNYVTWKLHNVLTSKWNQYSVKIVFPNSGVKLEFHGTDADTDTDTDIRDAPIV